MDQRVRGTPASYSGLRQSAGHTSHADGARTARSSRGGGIFEREIPEPTTPASASQPAMHRILAHSARADRRRRGGGTSPDPWPPPQAAAAAQQFGCCDPGWRRWRRRTQRRLRSQQQVGGNVGQGHDALQLPRLLVDDYKPPHRCGRQPARRISASPEAARTLQTAQQRCAEARQLATLAIASCLPRSHVSDVW